MRLNGNSLSKIIFGLLIITAVLSLFINKGLYYFELNNNVEVNITGTQNEISDFINKINDTNLVRIDRVNNVLYFENEGADPVKVMLDSINLDRKVDFVISTDFYERSNVIINNILINLYLIAASVFVFIYFLLKQKNKLSGKQNLYILLNYFELVFFSNLILAGLFSLLSRYYQIREIDLIIFFLMNIWISLMYFSVIWRINPEDFEDISSLYASDAFYHKRYLYIAVIILLSVSFGLGVNFIVTAALIFVSLLMTSFTYNNLKFLINIKFQRPNINLLNRPILKRRDKAEEPIISTSKSSTKKNKKNKSKKKKKK